jgi:multidrug efflux pump subunit AcrB
MKLKEDKNLGLAGRIADMFVTSKLTPLLIIASIFLGAAAVWLTPKEEEPQIIVPMIDVMIPFPGASPKEVEERVTTPMEKLFWGIQGVEYVYSISRPEFSLITVRFKVGSPLEESLVKVHHRVMESSADRPAGVMFPLVKSYTIDDVPFYAATLHGKDCSDYDLRKIGLEVSRYLSEIPDVSKINVIGGRSRQIRIIPDPEKLKNYNTSIGEIIDPIVHGNVKGTIGKTKGGETEWIVELNEFFADSTEAGNIVVAIKGSRPVYLKNLARVEDGPAERTESVLFGSKDNEAENAVTLSFSKRPGTNATLLSQKVFSEINRMKGNLIPKGIDVTITRDYGKTAQEKSNELIKHLLLASLSVVIFIAITLGLRFSLVVGIAVPVTLALTLLIYYLFGYTLNRVTLFALIFSIGILVDDAIVVIENVQRHFSLHKGKKNFRDIVVQAVNEVGNPTILATFTVIAAILPMAFVRGLMGPYMRPIPVGASIAMIFSLIIAFVVSPWAAMKLYGKKKVEASEDNHGKKSNIERLYTKTMQKLIGRKLYFASFFGVLILLFAGAILMFFLKVVRVKMLPFDNKSEIQVVIDLDEGKPLDETLFVAKELAGYIKNLPEVTDYEIYAGTSAPFNFNGMVRHYFLRKEPQMADIQVNLEDKHERKDQSHEIAKRIRPHLVEIASKYGARIKVVEIPPGPPVLSTMVAEIYGTKHEEQVKLASEVKEIFKNQEGVVDVDWMVEKNQGKFELTVDRQKASLMRVDLGYLYQTVQAAFGGYTAGIFHSQSERETVPIWIQLDKTDRKDLSKLLNLKIMSLDGSMVPLSKIISVKETKEDFSIHHKNLKRVVYVIADLAGSLESPVYAISKINEKIEKISTPDGSKVNILYNQEPDFGAPATMKWDGEWQITYEVFRDMGLAFALVLILIYILVVGWFQSFVVPIVIMLPIPLSLIGIVPGHMIFGAFFTATSMIGFIAGAGIIVRNSIILVDFIELRLCDGVPLKEAVIEAGAIRFRPILLTAAAVVVGAFVILFDPIFQGLAISLMFGEVAAVLLSPIAIPLLYYKVTGNARACILHPKRPEHI